MENPLGQRLRELPGPLLLTGHTGFKGTWMTFLLEYLEVSVVGFSLPAEKESLFDRAGRTGSIPEEFADIRDYSKLEEFIDRHKPSTIIHMAAQPLVLKSYDSPRETFDINVMGTVNVLDIAFKKDFVKAIIVVTTDKVYRNDNSGQAFVESDPLEGKDPYSASKVGTEAVIAAWQQIAKVSGGPRLASVRAGNVIGGGDYAEQRLVPDIVREIQNVSPLEIRNPRSTRPWLYILDVLTGYICTIENSLTKNDVKNYNFAPSQQGLSVQEVINLAKIMWPTKSHGVSNERQSDDEKESKHLALDASLAHKNLGWSANLSQQEMFKATFLWWDKVLENKCDPQDLCREEIEKYFRDHRGSSETFF
jgi:CDP-glucose 4,6-dehydratase